MGHKNFYRPLVQLTDEEQAACFQILHTDPRPNIRRGAMMKIVENHIPFVITVANKYRSKNMEFLELVNEGVFGLIHAANTYIKNDKCNFLSYAVWYIVQRIQKALYDKSHTVGVPPEQISQANRVLKLMERGFDFEGAIEALGFETKKNHIIQAIHAMNITWIDTPVIGMDGEISSTIGENISTEDLQKITRKVSETKAVYKVINKLDKNERDIINRYFGLNGEEESLRSIAPTYHKTPERIRGIKNNILKKLRPVLRTYDFQALLT